MDETRNMKPPYPGMHPAYPSATAPYHDRPVRNTPDCISDTDSYQRTSHTVSRTMHDEESIPKSPPILPAELQTSDDVLEDPAFSYQGYQIVRGEYFAHINEPSITLNDSKLYVNSACLKKLPAVEYVQVLVNPEKKKLVIRPCSEDERDSFAWCTAKRKPKQVTCRMFSAMIVNLLGWNPNYRYKIIGKMVRSQGEYLFVFDLTATEIYHRMVTRNPDGTEKKRASRQPVYPEEWKNQFGLPVEEHRKALQINIFDGYAVFGIKENKKTPSVKTEQLMEDEDHV